MHSKPLKIMTSAFASSPRTEGQTESKFWANATKTLFWQSFSASHGVVYPSHVHPESNIVVCLAGSVEVGQLGDSEVAEPGEALVGNAFITHQSAYRISRGECRAVSLTIDPKLFDTTMSRATGRALERDVRPVLLGKIRQTDVHVIGQYVTDELRTANPDAQRLELLAKRLLAITLKEWPAKRIGTVER